MSSNTRNIRRTLSLLALAVLCFAIKASAESSFSSRLLSKLSTDEFVSDRIPTLISKRFLKDTDGTVPDTDGPDSDDPDDENPAPPLFPLTSTDYIGFGCAILGLMIAAGGGIGGGGILVPIYILIMKFNPKNAIPLSQITGKDFEEDWCCLIFTLLNLLSNHLFSFFFSTYSLWWFHR